jgi:dTDP-glucose 4,6-dehydratase
MSSEVEPVNIGNPEEISIKGFAEEVIKITGSSSKIVFKDLPIDDPKVRQPSIEKARRILGWEPKVKRIDGLRMTIDYFKQSI